MVRRRIGQESLGFGGERAGREAGLDELDGLIDWRAVDAKLAQVYAATKGGPAWSPLALFKALLLAVWYDLSDLELAEALDDRVSFRRFCGFARHEPTPERTAFVRFRKELVGRGLDEALFAAIDRQLEAACSPAPSPSRCSRCRCSSSPALFELATRHPPTDRLVGAALPVVEELAKATDQSNHLAVPKDDQVLVLAHGLSPLPMHYRVNVGALFPALETSSGLVLLAYTPEEERALRLAEPRRRRRGRQPQPPGPRPQGPRGRRNDRGVLGAGPRALPRGGGRGAARAGRVAHAARAQPHLSPQQHQIAREGAP